MLHVTGVELQHAPPVDRHERAWRRRRQKL